MSRRLAFTLVTTHLIIIESTATKTDGKGNIRDDTSHNISVNTMQETEQTNHKKIFL